MAFTSLTFNTTAKARTKKFQGRDYFVAPAVMMTEGVHRGNKGPIYYSQDFLANNVAPWRNGTPLTVYHPKRDGKHVSADDLEILDSYGVGFIRNTRYDRKKKGWKTECWFDKEQTKRVDDRVYNALKTGEVTEVSTGMFLKANKQKGEWNGHKYVMQAAKCSAADHLAVLPDQEGACSVRKGAGLLVNSKPRLRGFRTKDRRSEPVANELSFSDVSEQIRQALAAKNKVPGYSWNGHVVEVFDGYCVYCVYGGSPDYTYTYYRQDYSVKDDKVELTGTPTEVVRKVNYVSVNNSSDEEGDMAKGNKDFNRKAYINILVNERGFDEADRAWLAELTDEALQKIGKVKSKVTANAADDDEDEEPIVNSRKKEGKKRRRRVVVNSDPDDDDDDEKKKEEKDEEVRNAGKVTLDDLIANSDPKALRKVFAKVFNVDPDQLREQKLSHQREKARLVNAIVANEANLYEEEELKAKSMGELRKLAKLAANSRPRDDDGEEMFDWPSYAGANTPEPTVNSDEEEDRFLDTPDLFTNGEDRDNVDEDETTKRKGKRAKARV